MLRFAHQNLRLPSLATIQAFESAARLGSFGRAAEELCITASAIGKRISQLEAALGQPLFDRGSRGVSLTAARSEEHTSELQSRENLVCRLLLEKKNCKSGHDRRSG